jgi:hypothetical protein
MREKETSLETAKRMMTPNKGRERAIGVEA